MSYFSLERLAYFGRGIRDVAEINMFIVSVSVVVRKRYYNCINFSATLGFSGKRKSKKL